MASIGNIQLTDDSDIDDMVEFIEYLKEGPYVIDPKWSNGEIEIRTRVNEQIPQGQKVKNE